MPAAPSHLQLIRFAPAAFVVIWSSGWIVAKAAAPHADPLTFLCLRYLCAALLIGGFAWATGAKGPRDGAEAGRMLLSGVLIHGVYLGGVWWAIAQGLPAGISALLAAIQPLLASVLAAPLTGERLSARRWTGVLLGLAGMAVVLWPKLSDIRFDRLDGLGVAILVNVVAMVSVTLGTFHQKRALPAVDLRTLAAWQFVGAFLATLPVALLTESLRVEFVPATFGALAWSVGVLSVLAIGLMLLLIREGSVTRLSALIYLVPPVAALQAWALFGETLLPVQLAGMAVVAAGVFLATRPDRLRA